MKRREMKTEQHEPNQNNGARYVSTRVTNPDIRGELNKMVLWKCPLLTFHYFCLELYVQTTRFVHQLILYKKYLLFLFLLSCLYIHLNKLTGSHQPVLQQFNGMVIWSFYWMGLGILSSVGLGTGLHTFLLYLGPHIAAVTLAAFECQSLDFPQPPYPTDIICPYDPSGGITLWRIMGKVRWECFMWGTGTAIGELPPYFMARAARLHGQVVEEEGEVEDILKRGSKSWMEQGKVFMYEAVNRVGFMGILFCASIPNPLFDLAGITCGHFLIPFWTFFGATLIGKALIKMHIQKLFVIFLFSESHVQHAVEFIKRVPWAGQKMKVLLEDFLQKQKMKMHHKTIQEENWLSWIFGKVVMLMVVYFVVSIVNSMARANRKREKESEQ